MTKPLRAIAVDDEPLALERMEVICGQIPGIQLIAVTRDGEEALRLVSALQPDLILLDMTMPGLDGLAIARSLAGAEFRPTVIFVTAHENFAVEAFDLDAADYVLKPVTPERLARAVLRAAARRIEQPARSNPWLGELWVPYRSELLRISATLVERIDAERDYVRLHVRQADGTLRAYLLLQTVTGLEERLDPGQFIRVHRSTIVRRDRIAGLRHDGLGAWSVELSDGAAVRIGRTYLARVKALAGR
jgi:two-component system, LytTR family, response regulator AlgR